MRISKEPEVRRQEMIDTAMQIFASKGFEATTMTDIARAMNVVPGLCYRYFKSKQELYETALNLYAKECAKPVIKIFQSEKEHLEEYLVELIQYYTKNDGNEKYHLFFHKKGNEYFHQQLDQKMLDEMIPYMEALLTRLHKKGQIHIDDISSTTKFIIYGQLPIVNDESLAINQKLKIISELIQKVLK